MPFATPSHLTAAFAMYLLRVLRESYGKFLTLEDLVSRAAAMSSKDANQPFSNPREEDWIEFASKLLQDFAQLGLVQQRKIDKRLMFRGIFGEGPPPDEPRGDGPGDDGGGSGIGEVLAHRILFSLDAEDFDSAVDRSLEDYRWPS